MGQMKLKSSILKGGLSKRIKETGHIYNVPTSARASDLARMGLKYPPPSRLDQESKGHRGSPESPSRNNRLPNLSQNRLKSVNSDVQFEAHPLASRQVRGSAAAIKLSKVDMAQLGYHAAGARRQPRVAGRDVDFDLDTRLTNRSRSRGESNNQYNSLGDKHLKHFFMRESKRKDLRKVGLIDKYGNMVPSSLQRKKALCHKVALQQEELGML